MPTEDDWAEADMFSEETGPHIPRSPEQGVKDLTKRIAYLNKLLEAVRARGDEQSEPALVKQIRDANALLAQYRAMLDGRN